MNPAEEQTLFARAKALYQKQQFDESERIYRALFDSAAYAGQAMAAVGMIQLSRRDTGGAQRLFAESLRRGQNADSHFGLGLIAEHQKVYDQALQQFQQALLLNEHHVGARKHLDDLNRAISTKMSALAHDPSPGDKIHPGPVGRRPEEPKTVDPLVTGSIAKENAAFYRLLNESKNSSQLSRDTLARIDALEMSRSPRFSSYFMSLLVPLGFGICVAVGIVLLPLVLKSGQPRPDNYDRINVHPEPTKRRL